VIAVFRAHFKVRAVETRLSIHNSSLKRHKVAKRYAYLLGQWFG
jgi:hypothetical protein